MMYPRGRGGIMGVPLRKKEPFFNLRKKVPMATEPRVGGAKGLSGQTGH